MGSVALSAPNPALELMVTQDQAVEFPQMRWLVYANLGEDSLLNLKPDNFLLTEESSPISNLSLQDLGDPTDPSQSLVVALVLDCSLSMQGEPVAQVKKSAVQFVQNLGQRDLLNVFSFAGNARALLPQFSRDRVVAKEVIAGLGLKPATAFYDATYTVLQSISQAPAGKKALVILSDGAPGGFEDVSQHSLDDVVQFAKQGGISIWTIGIGEQVDRRKLEDLAVGTGGQSAFPATPEELDALYPRIAKGLHAQYAIEYTSELPADGRFHPLRFQLSYQGQTTEYQIMFFATPPPGISWWVWLLVGLAGLGIGLAAFLLHRRKMAIPRKCPQCGQAVQLDFYRCPHCGKSLKGEPPA
ncbi:MAG: VWA domain-containing protein [bacterium]